MSHDDHPLRPCGAAALAICCTALLAAASARAVEATERIAFKVEHAFEPQAAVTGELRVPESKRERLPPCGFR